MRHLAYPTILLLFQIVTLTGASAAPCPGDRSAETLRYTKSAVNLHSCASSNCETLVTLPPGEAVYEYRISGEWSHLNVASLNIRGAIATRHLSPECVEGQRLSRHDLTDDAVAGILISESLSRYSGSCPCPFNIDRGGRRCGGRSAYSRPGGASPLCYPGDISNGMIEHFRQSGSGMRK